MIQTAAQVMGPMHVLFSRRLHTPQLSHQWGWTRMNHAEALELKFKTYQYAPQVRFLMSDMLPQSICKFKGGKNKKERYFQVVTLLV